MIKITYYNKELAKRLKAKTGVEVEKISGGSTRSFGLSVFSEFTAGTASLMLVTGPEDELADVPFLYMKQDMNDKDWIASRGGNFYSNKLKDKMGDADNRMAPFVKFLSRLLPLKENANNPNRLVVAKKLEVKFDDVVKELHILATYNGLYAIVESDAAWKSMAMEFKVLLVKPANKDRWYVKKKWKDDFSDKEAEDEISPHDYEGIQAQLSKELTDMRPLHTDPYAVPKNGRPDKPENFRYPDKVTGNVYLDHDPDSKTDEEFDSRW